MLTAPAANGRGRRPGPPPPAAGAMGRLAGPPTRQARRKGANKVGRNSRCPCGSGKKYKRCCGRNRGMNNQRIAQVFDDIAGLLEIKGEKVFTVRAYQRAARTISRLPTELDGMVRDGEDLRQIPGVGKAISDKIAELVTTNRMGFYDRLKGELPDGMLGLLSIPGLGPKTHLPRLERAWRHQRRRA